MIRSAKKIVDYQVDGIPVVTQFITDSGEKIDNKFKVIGKVSKTNITRVFVDFRIEI